MSEHAVWTDPKTPRQSRPRHSDLNLTWSVDPEKRLVIVRFGNRLTIDLIREYAQSLRTDPFFEPTFSEIVDLQGIKVLDLQPEDFLKLSDKVDPFSSRAKRAFVVGSSGQTHAARIHKILGTHRDIEIFHSIEAAQEWINTDSRKRGRA